VFSDPEDLRERLRAASVYLADPGAGPPPSGIHAGTGAPGKLAFLYPGHGSERPGMLGELFPRCRALRESLEEAGAITAGRLPVELATLIGPNAGGGDPVEVARALSGTAVCQPALALIEVGLTDWLAELGVRPDLVAGHSFGELGALYGAGCYSRAGFLELAIRRGRLFLELEESQETPGGMLAVAAARAEVEALLPADGAIALANHNAPRQTLVSGLTPALREFRQTLRGAGIAAVPLKVRDAFHSLAMAPVREPEAALHREFLAAGPAVPVVACLDGARHPDAPAEIADRVAAMGARPVEFVAQVRTLWDEGARTYLEVGPGTTLTGLVSSILEGREFEACALDGAPGGLRGTLETLARLVARGVPLDLMALVGEGAQDGLAADVEAIGQATLPGGTAASLVEVARAVSEHQRTMRALLQTHEAVMTRLFGAPQEVSHPGPAPVLSALSEGAEVSAPLAPSAADGDLAGMLRAVVHAKTGYPEETLDPDLDLEGQLCIDSLKRVEILLGLEAALGPAAWSRVHAELDRLAQSRTLRDIQSILEELLPDSEEVVESARASASDASLPPCAPPPLYRGVMRPVEASLHPEGAQGHPGGCVLVTGAPEGLGGTLRRVLHGRGWEAELVPDAELDEPSVLCAAVDRTREEHGAIAGIVHTSDWDADPLGELPEVDLAQWRTHTRRGPKALFQLLSHCGADLRDAPGGGFVLVASGMGGDFGRGRRGPWGGLANAAALGITKTVPMEWPGCWARAVDLDPRQSADALAELLAAEAATPRGDVEVGYLDGVRHAFRPVFEPLAEAGTPVDLGDLEVFLFAGGARGIGPAVARPFARPGATLVFVGRSRLDEPATDAAREIRANLDALRAVGAAVEYHALDLRDAAGVAALVEDIYARHGRLDAAFLLAGVAARATMEQKSLADFGEVFDTKADPAFLLARALRPATLKALVFFASVSGRFGCRSQADYAAANEVLVRLGWRLAAAWPDTRVLAVAWGPWSERGMAADGAMLQTFRDIGVQVIEPGAGSRFLVEELRHGPRDQVEVVAGGGPWSVGGRPPSQGEAARGG
jgi:malonyl CoA-acyl carrier protein transacylase